MIFNNSSGIRRRIATSAKGDDGVSIIEVLAATIIFLVLSIGVAQATVTSIRFAADQRNRITALSLAATEIDKVRAYEDPFDIAPIEYDQPIDGANYTIERSTEWVDSSGLDIPCGAGGTGKMQYLRVNVRVTWDTRLQATNPVSSDTVIAPDGRINDPARGTIMVSVTGAGGSKSTGVAVTISPVSGGAAALDAQPDNTNSMGCTYALKVAPGTYSVAVAKSGYIGADQTTNPTQNVTVAAGGTVSTSFSYDNASTLALVYGSGSGSNWYPTNYQTTFTNTYGDFYVNGTASTVKLYPHGGYTAIAGKYVPPDGDGTGGCRAVDPEEWLAGTVGAVPLGAGKRSDPLPATAGSSASGTVRMGIVRVNNITKTHYVTAVSQATPVAPGQPTCAVGMTYRFGKSTGTGTESRNLVLPFGTWKLYTSTTDGGTTTAVTAANILPQTNLAPTGLVSAGTVTLDPRGAP